MTFADIEKLVERKFGTTFHDSEVRNIHIDYESGIAVFGLTLDMSSPDEEVEETERQVELVISGLAFLVIEPPDPTYKYFKRGALQTPDFFEDSSPDLKSLIKSLPVGAFCFSAYVHAWNSCVHVAGMNAEFKDLLTTSY